MTAPAQPTVGPFNPSTVAGLTDVDSRRARLVHVLTAGLGFQLPPGFAGTTGQLEALISSALFDISGFYPGADVLAQLDPPTAVRARVYRLENAVQVCLGIELENFN